MYAYYCLELEPVMVVKGLYLKEGQSAGISLERGIRENARSLINALWQYNHSGCLIV